MKAPYGADELSQSLAQVLRRTVVFLQGDRGERDVEDTFRQLRSLISWVLSMDPTVSYGLVRKAVDGLRSQVGTAITSLDQLISYSHLSGIGPDPATVPSGARLDVVETELLSLEQVVASERDTTKALGRFTQAVDAFLVDYQGSVDRPAIQELRRTIPELVGVLEETFADILLRVSEIPEALEVFDGGEALRRAADDVLLQIRRRVSDLSARIAGLDPAVLLETARGDFLGVLTGKVAVVEALTSPDPRGVVVGEGVDLQAVEDDLLLSSTTGRTVFGGDPTPVPGGVSTEPATVLLERSRLSPVLSDPDPTDGVPYVGSSGFTEDDGDLDATTAIFRDDLVDFEALGVEPLMFLRIGVWPDRLASTHRILRVLGPNRLRVESDALPVGLETPYLISNELTTRVFRDLGIEPDGPSVFDLGARTGAVVRVGGGRPYLVESLIGQLSRDSYTLVDRFPDTLAAQSYRVVSTTTTRECRVQAGALRSVNSTAGFTRPGLELTGLELWVEPEVLNQSSGATGAVDYDLFTDQTADFPGMGIQSGDRILWGVDYTASAWIVAVWSNFVLQIGGTHPREAGVRWRIERGWYSRVKLRNAGGDPLDLRALGAGPGHQLRVVGSTYHPYGVTEFRISYVVDETHLRLGQPLRLTGTGNIPDQTHLEDPDGDFSEVKPGDFVELEGDELSRERLIYVPVVAVLSPTRLQMEVFGSNAPPATDTPYRIFGPLASWDEAEEAFPESALIRDADTTDVLEDTTGSFEEVVAPGDQIQVELPTGVLAGRVVGVLSATQLRLDFRMPVHLSDLPYAVYPQRWLGGWLMLDDLGAYSRIRAFEVSGDLEGGEDLVQLEEVVLPDALEGEPATLYDAAEVEWTYVLEDPSGDLSLLDPGMLVRAVDGAEQLLIEIMEVGESSLTLTSRIRVGLRGFSYEVWQELDLVTPDVTTSVGLDAGDFVAISGLEPVRRVVHSAPLRLTPEVSTSLAGGIFLATRGGDPSHAAYALLSSRLPGVTPAQTLLDNLKRRVASALHTRGTRELGFSFENFDGELLYEEGAALATRLRTTSTDLSDEDIRVGDRLRLHRLETEFDTYIRAVYPDTNEVWFDPGIAVSSDPELNLDLHFDISRIDVSEALEAAESLRQALLDLDGVLAGYVTPMPTVVQTMAQVLAEAGFDQAAEQILRGRLGSVLAMLPTEASHGALLEAHLAKARGVLG